MVVEYWRKNVSVRVKIELDNFVDFARLTGDDAAHHLNPEIAREMGYKTAVSQGLLVMGLTGKASSEYLRAIARNGVTYGYDRLRFPSPVYEGEILTITYEPQSINEKNVVSSEIRVRTSNGDIAVAGNHLLKIFD